MSTWERYLNEYKDVADSWLKDSIAFKHYEFFKEFLDKDKLEVAEWEYFQALGDYIHAFNSLAIAKKNALGRINAPIDHYRKVFIYLAHGDDPSEIRAKKFMDDKEYHLPYFGESAKTEIIGHVFPDLYMFKNKRDEEALKRLKLDPEYSRGDGFFTKLDKFTKTLKPVVDDYQSIVGRRIDLPLNLEVDQFFSWLYETHGKRPDDIVITNEQIEMLWERFNEWIEGFVNFDEPGGLAKEELDYKRNALASFEDFGGPEKLREMINEGNALAAVNNLRSLIGLNLTHYMSWQRTFGTSNEEAEKVLSALLDCANGPYEGPDTVKPIFEALEEVEKPAIWDVISNVLWALNPDEYFPIKIRHFRKLADELGIKLSGRGRINPIRFDEMVKIGQAFKTALEPWQPKDMTDVQSFMWVVSSDESGGDDTPIKYWAIAPGRNAIYWEDWQKENAISIGWGDMGDTSQYSNLDEVNEKLHEIYDARKKNAAKTIYEFTWEMQKDDYVLAKQGKNVLLGIGKVTSDHYFDENREDHKNLRNVEWIITGNWTVPATSKFPIKTLTNMSSKGELIQFVNHIIQEKPDIGRRSDIEHIDVKDKNYYWLNANPTHWDIKSVSVGVKQTYSYLNEKGNPRRIKKYFDEVKPGDALIGYTTSPDKMITTLCQVTKGLHPTPEGDQFEFQILEQVKTGITWSELQAIPELSNAEPLHNNQGSLFKLTSDEYDTIRDIIDERNPPIPDKPVPLYSLETALKELFIDGQQLDEILLQLANKKNIVLQGPPGVGKTFIARRIAWLLMGEKNLERIEMIQFHQSYSYEDFMQGYRPNDQGGFELKNGIFFDFCLRAQREPDKPFVFVIDEINRGNLSRIFGELMMLIEADKRGKQFSVPLTYSKSRDERFYIPNNLHLIGTMNTADRSLALVDYALRRRFVFFDLEPAFNMPKFKKHLTENGISSELCNVIIERFSDLNVQISNDTKSLGEGFRIGHSYFCPLGEILDEDNWYHTIIKTEIEPLLKEYWFDDESRVRRLADGLQTG